jgi:hypothetical protein
MRHHSTGLPGLPQAVCSRHALVQSPQSFQIFNKKSVQLVRAFLLIVTLVPLCWLGMQIVHEAGHVLAAWTTGAEVTAVVLHPLAISRTDVASAQYPQVIVWSGPLLGIAAPVLVWALAAWRGWPSAPLWRFFAGFCLVANGVYIGSGAINPVGDAADLLRLGTPRWLLALFGLLTTPAGIALWHRQARHLGWGTHAKQPAVRSVWTVMFLLVLVVVAELLWSAATGFR